MIGCLKSELDLQFPITKNDNILNHRFSWRKKFLGKTPCDEWSLSSLCAALFPLNA